LSIPRQIYRFNCVLKQSGLRALRGEYLEIETAPFRGDCGADGPTPLAEILEPHRVKRERGEEADDGKNLFLFAVA